MAEYHYACHNEMCDVSEKFVIHRSMTEPEGQYECPKCNAALSRIYSIPAILFQGKGFYSTDK